MAIKKADVLSADANHIKKKVADLEQRADEQLAKSGSHTIRLTADRFATVIGHELKRKYEAAGWVAKISEGHCQREGSWYNVEIS